MTAAPLLDVKDLEQRYALPRESLFRPPGQVRALNGVSVQVQAGKSNRTLMWVIGVIVVVAIVCVFVWAMNRSSSNLDAQSSQAAADAAQGQANLAASQATNAAMQANASQATAAQSAAQSQANATVARRRSSSVSSISRVSA